jgi:hypothetical protein
MLLTGVRSMRFPINRPSHQEQLRFKYKISELLRLISNEMNVFKQEPGIHKTVRERRALFGTHFISEEQFN